MLLTMLVVIIPIIATMIVLTFVIFERPTNTDEWASFGLSQTIFVLIVLAVGTMAGLSMEKYTTTRIACENAGGVISEWTWQCVTPSETIELPE